MTRLANPNQAIKLVLFDVDGVLTDGTLYIDDQGEAYKPFNAKDGVAVALLKRHGIKSGIVSGKSSQALLNRARQLKVDVVDTDCSDKLSAVQEIATALDLDMAEISFVGDDIIDYHAMNASGISFAPCDAHPLILECANHVTSSPGGKGVAREVAERILFEQGYTLHEMYAFMLNQDGHHGVIQ